MILKNADDLIHDYDKLIVNHKSNNTNRNATFENQTEFLNIMTRRSNDLDAKLQSYLSMSKHIYIHVYPYTHIYEYLHLLWIIV